MQNSDFLHFIMRHKISKEASSANENAGRLCELPAICWRLCSLRGIIPSKMAAAVMLERAEALASIDTEKGISLYKQIGTYFENRNSVASIGCKNSAQFRIFGRLLAFVVIANSTLDSAQSPNIPANSKFALKEAAVPV